MTYLDSLRALIPQVIETLRDKGIEERYLRFGGPCEAPSRQPRVPTDARSEFLANRAMGDWAEEKIREGISAACPQWTAISYGDADRIAAGEPGFKEFYIDRMESVRTFGKRPDLLLFRADAPVPANLSAHSFTDADPFVQSAVAAIEVRSSKFEALTYMSVRAEERKAGKRGGRASPSFTVKVEDLVIVYRWIERYGLPQAYIQVFFDSAFAINVLAILETVGRGEGFTIEKPEKSQEKATIMIPIASGVEVGALSPMPRYKPEERVTRLGRHDAYVVPTGGVLHLDPNRVQEVLGA